MTKSGEGYAKPARIVPWAWDDPWAGHAITEGSARAEAYYAQQMHDAAMRDRLDDFMNQPKRTPQ
jgi:hypothetical protein